MKYLIAKFVLIVTVTATLFVVLSVLFGQLQNPKVAEAAALDEVLLPSYEEYYIPLPSVTIPPLPKIQNINDKLDLGENFIFGEILYLPQEDWINKFVQFVDLREERLGLFLCNEEMLQGDFIPFDEYLQITYLEDYDSAMIIIESEELALVLEPWGISFTGSGVLEISEEDFFSKALVEPSIGEVWVCWGGPLGKDLVVYGNLEGFFSSLFQD